MATTVLAHAVPTSGKSASRYASLDTFAQALSYVANNYVEPVDERKVIYGAIDGMLDRLDEHSGFFAPGRYKRLREDTEGEFGGVGISLAALRSGGNRGARYPVVEALMPGSPAARAGVRVGDRLLSVDGRTTAGTHHRAEDWHSRLRGRSGTRVTIEIERSLSGEVHGLVLVRERVKVPTVEWHPVQPGIGYIAISKFQDATSEDVRTALQSLRPNQLQALILDLRNNPGGILDQAVQVADLFLKEGTIVTIRGRLGTRVEREVARHPGTWTNLQILVLIDQASASATEILAGALQDHGRAVLMGLPSFGKGSVQTFFDLSDGSGLKLTTARYYTPAGQTLEATGIMPDIYVEPVPPGAGRASSFGRASGSDNESDEQGSDSHDVPAGVNSVENRIMRERIRGDHQLKTAYQTVTQWLGSKHSASR